MICHFTIIAFLVFSSLLGAEPSSRKVEAAIESYFLSEDTPHLEEAEEDLNPDLLTEDKSSLQEAEENLNSNLAPEAKPSSQEADVASYLIPNDHPIKQKLDKFFSSRVISNLKNLKKEGFKAKSRRPKKVTVAKHPRLPGYVFKLYLDSEYDPDGKSELRHWILRIQGAKKIRDEIKLQQLDSSFKVPQKWIYRLPEDPASLSNQQTRRYILVEEDMNLVSAEKNKRIWASRYVKRPLLKDLFHLIKKLGLADCLKISNVPFSKDGRIAFIDTEVFNRPHIRHHKIRNLRSYLSPSNKNCWDRITKDE